MTLSWLLEAFPHQQGRVKTSKQKIRLQTNMHSVYLKSQLVLTGHCLDGVAHINRAGCTKEESLQ